MLTGMSPCTIGGETSTTTILANWLGERCAAMGTILQKHSLLSRSLALSSASSLSSLFYSLSLYPLSRLSSVFHFFLERLASNVFCENAKKKKGIPRSPAVCAHPSRGGILTLKWRPSNCRLQEVEEAVQKWLFRRFTTGRENVELLM